jgi:hypothetical protein
LKAEANDQDEEDKANNDDEPEVFLADISKRGTPEGIKKL